MFYLFLEKEYNNIYLQLFLSLSSCKNEIACFSLSHSRFSSFWSQKSSSLPTVLETKFLLHFWFDQRQRRRRKSASTHMGCIMVIGKRICEHGKLEAWSFNGDIHGRIFKEEDEPKSSMVAVQGGQNRAQQSKKKTCVLCISNQSL